MPYNLEQWKKDIWANLTGWKARLVPTMVNSGYVAVAAGALWPLLYEARTGDAFGAAMALMTLTAGLGTNLLSEQVLRWKDEANGELDLAKWLQAHVETDTALRAEVDRVLGQLDALALARSALAEDDRAWFEATLSRELNALGNLPTFQASVNGDRNILVQGEHNQVTFTVIERQEVHHHHAPDPRALEADRLATARRSYLKRFEQWADDLPLTALGGEDGAADALTLKSVYIALNTTTREHLSAEEEEEREKAGNFGFASDPPEKHTRLLTALEAARRHPRLVLLGDPGSGKSTFARHWLRQLALAGLGGEAPPGLDAGLLPVFVTLRDLAPRLAPLEVQEPLTRKNKADLIHAILAQIEADVRDTLRAPEFADGLRRAVDDGAVVLVLDGLDEVAYVLRERVRQAVSAFITDCRIQHVLITCRVRSYAGAAVFPAFQSETLAPFTDQHIRDFAMHWYDAQKARFGATQATSRSDDLSRAALGEGLFSLAQNPMMLTSMAILHQRDIGLPRERVRLFSQLVDVLLRRWQKSKTETLADFLQDELRLRATMERLAFEVHARGQRVAVEKRGDSSEAGDLPRGEALTLLDRPEYLQSVSQAEAFLDYVDQRAGLVVGRGGEPGRPASYSFPHRTLQEYLAGCYLASGRQAARVYLERAAENDYWALAAQYGAEDLLHNRRHPNDTLDLAYQLLSGPLATQPQRRAALWSGNYAALVGAETVQADNNAPHGGPGYLERIRPALVSLLASDLTPPERVEAGRSLAALGDPRDEVMTVDGMLFSFVPGGPFRMGSDKANDPALHDDEEPAHTLELPDYWIGVHPVTNAQFAVFVAENGYNEEDLWPEAIAADYWKAVQFKGPWEDEARDRPARVGPPYDLANHPVVGITWYEALAFARWLNRRHVGQLPSDLAFGLPSEAEWEKGARGGLSIPAAPLTRAVRAGLHAEPLDMQENALPERRYPWPGDFDSNDTNTSKSNIGSTSALGAFAGGASPYGCQDMSGNVFEWTRSLFMEYPYAPIADRENLAAHPDTARVLRGGAFIYEARSARCAFRFRNYPNNWYDFIGFRVVASPFFSRL